MRKRRILFFICLAFLLVASCSSRPGTGATTVGGGPTPVSRDSKFGYIDKTGKMVIEPQFEIAREFSDGLASVRRTFMVIGSTSLRVT